MALTRFRVRSPERDRETDASRLRRLRQLIAELRAEMERERTGLRDRYEKVTANAAFSLLALEEDGSARGVSSKIGGMTETMIHYARRMSSLEVQIGFVSDLDQQVALFAQGNEAERGGRG
jgi:hypothetical protein